MANINVRVGYTLDKTSFNEIKKQLEDIQKLTSQSKTSDTFKKQFEEASKAASQLIDILNNGWNSKIGQFDLSKVNQDIKATYGNVQNLQKALAQSGNIGVSAYNNFARSVLSTNLQLKQTSKILDNMAITLKNTIRYGISSSIFNNFSNSIRKAYDYTVQLDTSLNDIRIVTGKSAEEMDKFAIRANKVAKDLGRSTKDFTEASLIYYQQGLGNEEAQARAEVTLKAANVTGQTGQEVSEQLTAVWNGYKVTSDEVELYVDKLAAVAAGTAADLEELSTGMSKVASAANLMGVDIDQLNAQLATIVSVTRQAPESVGVALKTIYARMSDIKSGLSDETTLGNYTEKMAAYGFNVLDANNNLRDMGEVIEEIGNKWTSMSREQQVALAQTMAGTRQYNNLLSLFDNWDMYEKSLKMSAEAAGTLQEQQDIYMDSTKAHLQQLSTEAERTYDILFNQKTVNGFTDALTGTLTVFNDLLAGLGGGARDFIFFGNLLAGIFNKQIGASIERQIENIESMRANIDALNFKGNISESIIGQQIIGQHQLQGETIGSAGLEKEATIANQLLQVRQALSSEQYNELTNLQTTVGLTEDKIVALTEIRNKATEILDVENVTTEEFKERLSLEQEELQIQEAASKKLKGELRFYKNADLSELDDEDTEYLFNTVEALKMQAKETKDINILDEASIKISEKKALTETEIQTIIETQNSLIEDQKNFLQQVQDGLDNSTLLDKLKEEQFIREKLIQQQIEQAQRQQIISNAIRGMAGMVSTLTAISGIASTITDKQLQPWDRFKRILTTIVASAPAMIMAFKGLTSIIPALTIGMQSLATALGVTGITATTSFGQATAAVLTFETALGPLWLILLAVTAAVTAVGVAVYQYQKEQNAANQALLDAQEYAKQTKQDFLETKQAYDDLKSSLEKYKNSVDALKKLTKGTQEWKEAIIEINSQVLDLMDKYPQLVQMGAISTNENGMMQISDAGWDQLMDEQFNKVSQMQGLRISSQISVEEKELGVEVKKLRDTLDSGILDDFSDDDIKKLAQGLQENSATLENSQSSLDDFKNSMSDLGFSLDVYNDEAITKLKKSIIDNRSSINGFNTAMDGYTIKVGEYTTELVKALNQGNTDYTESENQKYLDKKASAEYSKARSRAQEDLARMDFSDVASLYASYFGSDKYKDNGARINGWNKYITKDHFEIQNEEGQFVTINYDTARQKLLDTFTNEYLEEYSKDAIKEGLSDIEIANRVYDDFSGHSTRRIDEHTTVSTPEKRQDVGNFIADILSLSEEELLDKYSKEELELYSSIIKNGSQYLNTEYSDKNFNPTAAADKASKLQDKALGEQELQEKWQIDYGRQYGNEVNNRSKNLYAGIQSGDVTAENIADNEDYKVLINQLDTIKKLYPEVTAEANILEETWMVGSQEYLEALGKIQDKLYDTKMKGLIKDADESRDKLKDYLDKNKLETNIEFKADDEEFKKLLNDYLDKEYAIDINLHAEAENEFDDIVGAMDDINEKASLIGENFVVSANDIRELNNTFPGIIQNMKDLGNGSVQLNEDIVKSAINMAQAEVAADSQATIDKLQNQATLLRQKQAVYQEMANAAIILSQDEVASEEIAAQAKATLSEDLTKLEGLNEEIAAQQAMDNDKAVADASYENGQITAKNWNSAYQSAANSSYHFATTAIANNRAAAGQGSPVKGDFGVNYQGSTGTSSEAKVISGTKSALENNNTSTAEWAKIAQKYQMLADNAGKNANDIEGMIAEIGARNVDFNNLFNNIRTGQGSKGKSGNQGKEAKTIELTKNEVDRYHQVDTTIEKLSNDLDKLENSEEKAFGGDWVAILIDQLKNLNQQVDTYKEKLQIARGEQSELRNELAKQGVQFNANGTVANYTQALNAQLAQLNALEAQYNSLSAAQQEQWDNNKIIDNAKESFNTFKEHLDRYDELVSNFIPEIEQKIQDAIDEMVEKQIERFNKGVDLRLDMAEAERDWNKFKTNIIDGIDEDDIIGQTEAKLRDFATYYNDASTGTIQALTKHLNDTMNQVREKISHVYGKDDVKEIEDLQKYYEELMEEMEDVFDLQKEIHENYLDMMDEAQDKFDEQIDMYQTVSDLIEHDMNLIELVYGEGAYGELAKFYDKQQENYRNQLDFQRKQVDFWKAAMDGEEEGSEAWENARDKWIAATSDFNDLIETSIENLQDKYVNAIEEIFDKLNDEVTKGKGLDFIDTEWQLINKGADQYLDTINQLFETQALENKYLDAIDNTDNLKAQKQLKELMDEELTALREKDKLTKYDIDRANKRYEIALKQIALEEAQQNKSTMRLRRDSQGNYRYEYVADNDAIDKARDELEKLKNDLYNFDKKQYEESLGEMYDTWVDYQDALKEAAQINDPEERAAKEALIKEKYGDIINGMLAENDVIRRNLEQSAFEDLAMLYDKNLEDYTNMTEAQKDELMGNLVPAWQSGIQDMIDTMVGEGGFYPVCEESFEKLEEAQDEFAEGFNEIQEAAKQSFEEIASGVDDVITQTTDFLQNNTSLIDAYNNNFTKMKSLLGELDNLSTKFSEVAGYAKTAAEEAHNMLQEINGENADAYDEDANAVQEDTTVIDEIEDTKPKNETPTTTTTPTTSTPVSQPVVSNPYAGYRLGGQKYTIKSGDTLSAIAKRYYNSASLYTEIWAHNKNHLRGKNANQIWPGEILYLNTGGYTGDWSGTNGRIAMLHQKELVLNAQDTENMLNAISVMRNLTNSVGIATLARLASLGAGGSAGVGGNGLEQNVHISASFPNATSSREIEEALLNLTNRASQMVGRR